jgi:hypothetical protein
MTINTKRVSPRLNLYFQSNHFLYLIDFKNTIYILSLVLFTFITKNKKIKLHWKVCQTDVVFRKIQHFYIFSLQIKTEHIYD